MVVCCIINFEQLLHIAIMLSLNILYSHNISHFQLKVKAISSICYAAEAIQKSSYHFVISIIILSIGSYLALLIEPY